MISGKEIKMSENTKIQVGDSVLNAQDLVNSLNFIKLLKSECGNNCEIDEINTNINTSG